MEVPKTMTADEDGYESSAFLQFAFPDVWFAAELKLNNTPDTMDIPRVHFHAQQGHDVTFKPGEGGHVELDFAYKIEGDAGDVKAEHLQAAFLVKSDTEENVVERYHSSFPTGL